MLRDGHGVAKDLAEALRWFEVAAAAPHCHAKSQCALGALYSNGE
jgi:TPR repeat protein